MTSVTASPQRWIRRPHFPPTRYTVRAWGSDRHPDLNYETDDLPLGLHKKYPFVDVSNVDRPSRGTP